MKEPRELWTHQREIAARAAKHDGFALFMEMGTGKSGTAVTALRHRCYEAKRLLRTLILCPPAMVETWRREVRAFSTIKDVYTLTGSGRDRCEEFRARTNGGSTPAVIVANYESLLMKPLFELLRGWAPEAMILDESHRLKNRTASRTKLVTELADRARFRLLLSGTPILNTPMDVWAQFRILDGGETFDRNFFAFRARYFIDRNAGMPAQKYFPDWRPKPGIEAEFNELIYRKAARVTKDECLDLPPLVRERIDVPIEGVQARMYAEMRDEFITTLEDKTCVAQLALTKAIRLQQIVSGFFVDEDGTEIPYKENARLEALRGLLEEIAPHHKVIVWTSFRASYGPIEELCASLGLPSRSLYGGMTDKNRQGAVDDFQRDPSVRVMIANASAGGVGITLTAANHAIYYSRTFSLEQDVQSEARCHRGGSEIHEKITRIDLVAPDTIDELILDALSRKEDLATNILSLRGKL